MCHMGGTEGPGGTGRVQAGGALAKCRQACAGRSTVSLGIDIPGLYNHRQIPKSPNLEIFAALKTPATWAWHL